MNPGETTITETSIHKKLTTKHFYLIAIFVILLIAIIIAGRILNKINLSNCREDNDIQSARKWAAWTVGLSSVGAAAVIILFIVFLFKKD